MSASAWRHDPAARVALLAIAISGIAALALEVVWTRILTLSFSGTVYSFAIMLASFLFGISCGSHAAASIDASPDPVRYFAFVELWLGFSVACSDLARTSCPGCRELVWGLTAVSQGNFAFGAISAQSFGGALSWFRRCILGATFPAAVRICTFDAREAGRGAGSVYAANTAGAILGSLFAGFVLIPTVGSLIAGRARHVFAANGCMLARRSPGRGHSLSGRSWPLWQARCSSRASSSSASRQTVANYSLQQNTRPELIYHGEGIAHSVDIVRAANRNIIMMVDGNTEADTSFIQRRHFILKGHLPLLLHPAPREVAVIGLGLGITLSATDAIRR